MSQPRWDPDERRWMLDDEHSYDAPRRRRAPTTDRRPSAGIDLREPDTRAVRGSMTVAELTHSELHEDQDPRFGSRDHEHRGSRDARAFDDRWTRDVPRPSAPGRGGLRAVAGAAADRRRYEEAGYGADRYDTGSYGDAGRDLPGRYEDARYVRDALDAGRNGGSRNGTGRFDADVLGWGRTSAYGTGSDDVRSDVYGSDLYGSDVHGSDAHRSDGHDLDDHGSTGRNGGGRYGMDALDPGWRAPSPDGAQRSGRDALDTGDLGRYGSDPYADDRYADDPYADGARNGVYRNGSDRSWPTNGHPGRDELDRHGAGYHDGSEPGGDPYRNGVSRNGNGRPVRNDLDVDRGEAARLDDAPYGYEVAADDGRTGRYDDAGGRRNGAGRVDRAPYSRPRRVVDGDEPEPEYEYPVRGRSRHDEPVDVRDGARRTDLEETYDGRRNGRRRAYEDSYDDQAYDDQAYDDQAYDDHADGGHVVDDGYGTDPGGRPAGTGRAARRRAREREEDDRSETRQFDLAADEEPDLDPESEPAPADDAADGATGTRRKKRRRWPWIVGGAAVAGGLAVPIVLAMQDGEQGQRVSTTSAGFGAASAAPVDGNPDAPAAGAVTFQITGSGTANSVTYGRGTSVSQVSGVQLPWEQTMTGVNGGSEYTLTATAAEGADEISCRISVDGAVIAEQKANGEYAAVSCAGRR